MASTCYTSVWFRYLLLICHEPHSGMKFCLIGFVKAMILWCWPSFLDHCCTDERSIIFDIYLFYTFFCGGKMCLDIQVSMLLVTTGPIKLTSWQVIYSIQRNACSEQTSTTFTTTKLTVDLICLPHLTVTDCSWLWIIFFLFLPRSSSVSVSLSPKANSLMPRCNTKQRNCTCVCW